MKKILFGTSALIATAFASVGGASAAGLELGFGGSYVFGGGFVYSKDYPGRDYRGLFVSDAELVATAKGTLDNGLSFGARVELNVESAFSKDSDHQHYDESVGWVEGGFGRVEVGHEDGAHDRSVPGVPGAWFNAADASGLLFDYGNPGGGDWSLDGDETSDALKVTYWTPSFSGFKAGATYIPNSKGGRGSNTEWTRSSDAWEFGVRYTGNFNDVRVDVGGGYTIDPKGNNTDDSWAVGGNVGFQQFTVGGTYEDKGAHSGFGVGGTYNTGPWTFGASYANGKSILQGASLTTANGTKIDLTGLKAQGASVGVDYQLGQGVVISAGAEWQDYQGANDIFGAGLVTRLSF